tara:strand:- start:387 stop:494 length:108 start_codon:yes stop_codon:yes gene_type:complete
MKRRRLLDGFDAAEFAHVQIRFLGFIIIEFGLDGS